MAINVRQGIVFNDPRGEDERRELARLATERLGLTMPTAIDPMDDRASRAYAAHPERIYVVGTDGRIAYRGEPGPGGFDPAELERFLESYLAARRPARGPQPARSLGSRPQRQAAGRFG